MTGNLNLWAWWFVWSWTLVDLEPLARLLLCFIFTTTWLLNLHYRDAQPPDEVNCERLFGGNFRFMTDINHQLNVITSALFLIASVYPTRPVKRLSSWLQGTVVAPNAVLIVMLFWGAYWTNSEATYSTYGHRWRPFYLCHVQHTLIVVTSLLEALVRPHSLLWDSSKPALIVWYAYAIWNIHIRRVTGHWVYAIFTPVPITPWLELVLILPIGCCVLCESWVHCWLIHSINYNCSRQVHLSNDRKTGPCRAHDWLVAIWPWLSALGPICILNLTWYKHVLPFLWTQIANVSFLC